MANPKYAGLPGIASPDEKDVYETDDLPEADQDPEYTESESESIERPHLDISKAHSRFRDKFLICNKDVDFSDKYRRKRNTGYKALHGDWEIAGEGDNETIFQRCNRLNCEFNELLEDINKLKEETSAEKKKELEMVEPLVPQLQLSLHQINNYLNSSDSDNEFMKFLSDPQESQIKKLLSKLEQLKDSGKDEKSSGKSKKDEKPSDLITYHLQTFPAQNKFIQTARLASLEQRINKLESVLGTTPDNLNRLQLSEFTNVSEAAKEISARVNLLDTNKLDKIEGRLGAVLAKMDALAEKKGGQGTLDQEKKINELYESLGKAESLSLSIKPVMDRLIALNTLHAEEFKKSLKELETDQVNASVSISKNETVLKNVQDALEKHLEIVARNIKAFDDRLGAIKK
ncbi:dynactin subunit, putative [Pediculus humanus corporis]|uniref:Dynactin subunit, putative n=1 Tax=Pediculus humanus subsp. corporis TaxID=121224 RepID=E0VFY3_PEDHC|nr:dynactin subunit, putative [Pediculus humanus corporis]EEB12289.1 dynactin subunit, putative [Pediculus humanus corporis]